MRTKKIGLAVLAIVVVVIIALELEWRINEVKDLTISSPSGHYIATVRKIYFGEIPVGNEVYIRPKWMPLLGTGSRLAFAGYCPMQIEWKNDKELQILCPKPEGVPRIRSNVWSVKITYDGSF